MENERIFRKLLEVAPGFEPQWDALIKHWEPEEPGSYTVASELAHYLVDSYGRGTTEYFDAFFKRLEELFADVSPEEETLLVVGLLEDIQNISSHRPFGRVVFERWLQPRTLTKWREIERFWEKVSAFEKKELRKSRSPWWLFWRRKPARRIDPRNIESPELRRIVESMYREEE